MNEVTLCILFSSLTTQPTGNTIVQRLEFLHLQEKELVNMIRAAYREETDKLIQQAELFNQNESLFPETPGSSMDSSGYHRTA